jgi:predicted small metal-binding protein
MLELRCGELFDGCEGIVRAETHDEVLRQAAAHAAEAHGVTEVDAGTRAALVAATRPV